MIFDRIVTCAMAASVAVGARGVNSLIRSSVIDAGSDPGSPDDGFIAPESESDKHRERDSGKK